MVENKKQELVKTPYVVANIPVGSGKTTYSDQNLINYKKLMEKK